MQRRNLRPIIIVGLVFVMFFGLILDGNVYAETIPDGNSYYYQGDTEFFFKDTDRNYGAVNREYDRAKKWAEDAPDTEIDQLMAVYSYVSLHYQQTEDRVGSLQETIALKKGVCGNYTRLFRYFVDEMGFRQTQLSGKSEFSSSPHAWNAIEVDNEWYFVDMYWDIQNAMAGYGTYHYFLKSASGFKDHADYESKVVSEYIDKCTSTRFDDYWWDSNDDDSLAYGCIPVPYKGNWYYVTKGGSIVKRNTVLADAEVTVIRDNGEDGIYCGHGIAIEGNKLYFMGGNIDNPMLFKSIYRFDLSGDNVAECVFTSQNRIRSFGRKGKGLFYHDQVTGKNIPLDIPGIPVPPTELNVTPSDTDDGKFREVIQFRATSASDGKEVEDVDWAGKYTTCIDKNGKWRATGAGRKVIYAFTPEGVYKELNVAIPSGGINPITSVVCAESEEGKHTLYWSGDEKAEKYVIFTEHRYPINHVNVSQDHSYECIGETSDNWFTIPDDKYDYRIKYNIVPVNSTGAGEMKDGPSNQLPYDEDSKILLAPKNVRVSQVSDEAVRVEWDPVEGAKYYFYWYLDKKTEELKLGYGNHYQPFVDVKGLEVGKEYIFFITAQSGFNRSESGMTSLKLDHMWNKEYTLDKKATCTEEGSESIHCSICEETKDQRAIKAKGHSFGDWNVIKKSTCEDYGARQHSCLDCGLTETENLDPSGHNWSAWKVTKKATETANGENIRICSRCNKIERTPIPKAKVSAPTGKVTILNTIANSSKKTNDVIWDKSNVKGATNYEINWKVRGSSKWASTIVGNNVRGTTKGLSIKGLYDIRVRPVKAATGTSMYTTKAKYGAWSNTVYRYFHTTEKIRLASNNKGSFTMNWNKNPQATGYQVMFTTNKNGSGAAKNINTVVASATSFTKKGLKSGTTYYVQIREIKKVGGITYIGNISNPVAVKVK